MHSHPLSVLVVDDDEDTAQSTATLLTLFGHDVRTADGAEGAMREAAVKMPDLILLDIGMPGTNGWTVAARMRKAAPNKQPIVIAMTGYGTYGDRVRSADSGVDLHLVKPVDPERLLQIAEQIRGIVSDEP